MHDPPASLSCEAHHGHSCQHTLLPAAHKRVPDPGDNTPTNTHTHTVKPTSLVRCISSPCITVNPERAIAGGPTKPAHEPTVMSALPVLHHRLTPKESLLAAGKAPHTVKSNRRHSGQPSVLTNSECLWASRPHAGTAPLLLSTRRLAQQGSCAAGSAAGNSGAS